MTLTKQLNLDKNKKIKVPENMNQILIDVGLAGEAPNSGAWLMHSDDRFVIGIEPLEYHWSMIENYEKSNSLRPWTDAIPVVQLEEGVVKYQGKNFCEIKNRFMKIQCAVDSVENPTSKTFYQMDRRSGASGSSSLLKPTSNHPHFIENEIQVDVVSLEWILDHIDWERFPYIEHIKTDCEGKDFDAVRSIGKYLDKVLFITSEMSEQNRGHWEGSHNHNEFRKFMTDKGFVIAKESGGDILFINKAIYERLNLKTTQNYFYSKVAG